MNLQLKITTYTPQEQGVCYLLWNMACIKLYINNGDDWIYITSGW